MRADLRRSASLEVTALVLLALTFLWGWRGAFRGAGVVFGAVLLIFWVWAHRRRGESLYEVGFRIDNLGIATRLVVIYVGPWMLVAAVAAWVLGEPSFPPAADWPLRIFKLVAWGTLQQYVLLAFVRRRMGDVFSSGRAATVASAVVFGLLHLPNPFLVVVTTSAGALACWLYGRAPNLPALGIAHGLLSFLVYYGLPRALTGGMRVGPAFWQP